MNHQESSWWNLGFEEISCPRFQWLEKVMMFFISIVHIVRCLYNVVSRFCIGLSPFLLYNNPLKTNISPEKWWLEDEHFPFKMVPSQVTFVHFRGGYIACLALPVFFWNFSRFVEDLWSSWCQWWWNFVKGLCQWTRCWCFLHPPRISPKKNIEDV